VRSSHFSLPLEPSRAIHLFKHTFPRQFLPWVWPAKCPPIVVDRRSGWLWWVFWRSDWMWWLPQMRVTRTTVLWCANSLPDEWINCFNDERS
jgi:hypothetical protein